MATRYQREVIRFRISKKNRQHNGHKIPKGGYQIPYIEEEQIVQWPKEKVQKNKQRSTKHIHKTKCESQSSLLICIYSLHMHK
jgi:hypothetical protein